MEVSLNDAILTLREHCCISECKTCRFNMNLMYADAGVLPHCMFYDDAPCNWEPLCDCSLSDNHSQIEKAAYDYGIYDSDTLKAILETYRTVLIELTGNQMTKLNYTAGVILKVVYEHMERKYSRDADRA